MFNCERCEKKLWTSYHKLPDGAVVCNDCYSIYLRQILNKINDTNAYDIIYNFVKKYQGKFPSDLIQELLRLLEFRYNITVDVVALGEILHIIRDKIEKEDAIKKLALFERELKKDSSIVNFCEVCNVRLPKSEFEYSMEHFDKPLCLVHQKEKRASEHALKMYDALKKRGVECALEPYTVNKYFDISIKNAKLNIGIDGEHHSLDPEQLHLDLISDENSQKEGFATKHYTLREIDENLERIADTLAEVVKQRIKKAQKDEIFTSIETKHNPPDNQKKRDKKRNTRSS
ncbi:MAG: hypothetical protein JSW06_11070 [Thermoplasmatales archaeon]|nr:MAG: hypothetical protein JSW06_11070 [Thermoplasmatales archaeon]